MRPIIQAGMGINISSPHLANVCARAGLLGTVTGTACERIVSHFLQLGDPDILRAVAHFPFPEVAERVIEKHFIRGGKGDNPFNVVPMFVLRPRRDLIELTIVASFVVVWLAKEGHDNPISVNYLEKLQMGHLYHLTGAILARVDFVTMGAGIPYQIPTVLDALAMWQEATYRVDVVGGDPALMSFNPREFFGRSAPYELKRPGFLPIVSGDASARVLDRKMRGMSGKVQGLIVELPTAGGHNAPPRGKEISPDGQPVYGPKDEVGWERLQEFGIPFWVAGGFSSPEKLAEAKALGAFGTQHGGIFALCDDSGADPYWRQEMRRMGYRGELPVRTEAAASPTGFPFKVPQLPGTVSDEVVYDKRNRNCSRKALQFPAMHEGKVVYRCSAEPVDGYKKRGGKEEDTVGARCLCNGLFAFAGIGDPGEPIIATLGDDYSFLRHLMAHENDSYTAMDAIEWLLSGNSN